MIDTIEGIQQRKEDLTSELKQELNKWQGIADFDGIKYIIASEFLDKLDFLNYKENELNKIDKILGIN